MKRFALIVALVTGAAVAQITLNRPGSLYVAPTPFPGDCSLSGGILTCTGPWAFTSNVDVGADLAVGGLVTVGEQLDTPRTRYSFVTLGTCDSDAEGTTALDVASGVSTGARTRLCLCTSDGAGTPAYAWQNLASATVGTATTCAP